MLVDVRFLEVHDNVFHAGKNFGTKITEKHIQDFKLDLKYNTETGIIEIVYLDRVGWIMPTNQKFIEPCQQTQAPLVINEHKTEDKSKRSSAQVATPQSHVFEGRGAGRK